ncbi:MAG: amidohydrolase family protein, partial [Granulosicoccus sp.]
GEVTDPAIDIFHREAVLIETVLDPLRQRLPQLRIVMEHLTTADGARYVCDSDQNLAASITPHHLMINRNHMLAGGIRPHYYCLPIVKRAIHQEALIQAACSGDPRFFLGTDSAPHTRSAKLSECGCAGVFNAANAMACLATVFEEADALHHLEAFACLNGAKWYGVAPNGGTITLIKSTDAITAEPPIAVGDESVVPFDPGRPVFWQVEPAAQSV